MQVDPETMLQWGLQVIRIHPVGRKESNQEDFASHYGIDEGVAAHLWNMLLEYSLVCIRERKYFFLALCFIRKYPGESTLRALFGIRSAKTVRKWVWIYIGRISFLKEFVILMPGNVTDDRVLIWLTVDGTDCRINEPTPFSKKWYSVKFGGPAVKYEIGIDMAGNICWVSKLYRGGKSDLSIYQSPGGLRDHMPPNRLAQADDGYKDGDDHTITRIYYTDPHELRVLKRRALCRHEKVNGFFKKFVAFGETWIHGVEKHETAFHACAVLAQLSIEKRGGEFFI